MNTTPLEYEEECAFSDYLNARKLVHWHVPQETYTKSYAQKTRNRRQGVRRGVSDHWVIVPTKMGHTILVAIEMKRLKGGTVSDEQIEVTKALNRCDGVLAVVCFGAEQAIRVVEAVERNDTGAIKDIIDYTSSLKARPASTWSSPKSVKISQKTPKSDDFCPF